VTEQSIAKRSSQVTKNLFH